MPKEEKPSVQPSINNELLSKKSIFVAKVKYPSLECSKLYFPDNNHFINPSISDTKYW